MHEKEPGPIASDVFQTFWDFGIWRKLIMFLITLGEFYSWKCTVWKILMKMWLVMVTMIKRTLYGIGNCKIRNYLHVSKRFNRFHWNLIGIKISWVMTHRLNRYLHSEKSDHAPLILEAQVTYSKTMKSAVIVFFYTLQTFLTYLVSESSLQPV